MLPLQSALAFDDNTLPSGGSVVGGSAGLHYTGVNRLDIHQRTNRAVIDWNKFDIGKNATTQFHQPDSGSLAVNRVVGPGQDPTKILGTLKANGTVMVLDRNGVIFGADSRVDVGGIIASTGQVDTAAIMSGNGPIEIVNATQGAIVQAGMMTIGEAGLAAFVAPTITNSGLIEAKLGRVVLASGEKATVDLYGDGLVELATDKPLQHAAINNSGTVKAEGGTILMTASAAKDIVGDVINVSGIVNASSATVKGGKIILEGANTKVSGTLDASGKKGGGEILIGGDYQGGGGTRTAANTTITGDAVIKANTTGTDGDGGKVIVWADNYTSFEGSIEAGGGSFSGNGGFVETSGKTNLRVTGSVNASANNAGGKNGEWLLDPQNVRITNSAGASVPIGGGTYDPTGAANPFVILDSSISAALSAGNNVTITTYNAGQSQAGNIDINNATILKDNGGDATLTFKADGRIYTTGTNSITSTAGKLNTIFWMDADNNLATGGNGYALSLVNTTITTNGGDFFAGGGLDDGGAIYDAFGDLVYQGVAGDGRPDHFATSLDSFGINLHNDFSLDTGDGNITAFGRGGNSADWSVGISLWDAATMTARNGNTLLVTESDAAGTASIGLLIRGQISSTGTGTIMLSGTGGTTVARGGIVFQNQGTIKSHDAAITLIGKGATGAGVGHGIYMAGGGSKIESDGNATITLKGEQRGSDSSYRGIYLETDATVGGNDATGAQFYITDNMLISSTATLRTAGTIHVKPLTTSRNINVSGPTGGLDLNDTLLSRIFAGTLVIGDKDNGTGDVVIDSWDLSGKTHNVEIYGNDITVQDTDATATPGIQLGTGNLLMHARDNAAIDLGRITLNAAINKALAGHSKIDLRADESILMTSAHMLASNGGSFDAILNADRDADQYGSIAITTSNITTGGGYVVMGGGLDPVNEAAWGISGHGINYSGNITTGDGAITMTGHGHASGGRGISMTGGNTKLSTDGGTITLTGTGAAAGAGHGVVLSVASTEITSQDGDITIRGTGGDGGAGSNNNHGVYISNAKVTSTGTGANAAKITIDGTAGAGSAANYGILISGADALLTSRYGDIDLTGTGNWNGLTGGTNNSGIGLSDGAKITSTGAGADAARITIDGTGHAGNGSNHGLYMAAGTGITSQDGDITIKGTGGDGGTGSNNNHGVYIISNAKVTSTGTGANAAKITINGIGGNGQNYNYGVLFDTGAEISSQDGDISTTGIGGSNGLADGNNNHGIRINVQVTSTGTGANAAKIKLNGTGGAGHAANYGILVSSTGALLTSRYGDIDLTGTGNWNGLTGGTSNSGVGLSGGAKITSTGAGADAARITIDGTGHAGNGSNIGLYMADAGTEITSQDGDITIKGIGGDGSTGSNNNHGVYIISNAKVTSTGTGANAAKITINGIGGNGQNYNYGVHLISGAEIGVQDGDIEITGTGGTNGLGGTDNIDFRTDNTTLSTHDGNLTIIADTYNTTGTTTISAGKALTIKPRAASTTIGLGGGAGILNLIDLELTMLSAGTLVIGDKDNGTGDVIIDSWDLSGQTHDVEIYGGDITISSGMGIQNNSSNSVILAAQDIIDIDSRIDIGGALTLNAANGIRIADADIRATGIAANHTLTFDGTAETTRTLDVGSGVLSLAGAAAGNRNLILIGEDAALSDAITTSAGHSLTILPYTDNRAILLGGGTGGLNLDDTELSYLQADGLLTIGKQHTGTGALTVNSAAFAGDIALYGGNTILNGLSSTGNILVASQGAGNDITLTGDVVSNAAGDAIILASADDFFNNAASAGNALRATHINGRWLVYSERMDQNTRNGLMPHASEFGVTYPAAAAGAGNRFLYTSAVRPELTLTVNDGTVIAGSAYNPAHAGFTITGGLLAGDTRNDIGLTGDLDYATSYMLGTTPSSGTPYTGMITATGTGTLASALGYSFNPVISGGSLLVQKGPVPPPKSQREINLPPLINYYANLNAVTARYPAAIRTIRQPAIYVNESDNLPHAANIDGLLRIDRDVNHLEPASGSYLAVGTDIVRSEIMADNASCLVTNGFNGGCFIY